MFLTITIITPLVSYSIFPRGHPIQRSLCGSLVPSLENSAQINCYDKTSREHSSKHLPFPPIPLMRLTQNVFSQNKANLSVDSGSGQSWLIVVGWENFRYLGMVSSHGHFIDTQLCLDKIRFISVEGDSRVLLTSY